MLISICGEFSHTWKINKIIMTVTRSVSEAHLYAQKISANYIMPLDPDGTSDLSTQMLVAAMNQQLGEFTAVPDLKPRLKTIRVLGHLNIDKSPIFHPSTVDQDVPKKGFLKNIKGGKVSLKKAKIRKYSDFRGDTKPYLVCNVPNLSTMPIDIDELAFATQMKKYQHTDTSDSTSKPNQLCTWGAFVTSFHRDTMFSKKVHTLSPGSLKLWCFEQRVGQLDIINLGDAYEQMRRVTSAPEKFDFFIQEPGMVVEHDGGYAHYVITFNEYESTYEQWCALIGWEINTSRQINHCMRVETPLVQGKGGTLDQVSEGTYLLSCSKTTHIQRTQLKMQGGIRQAFLDLQKEKSQKSVEKLDRSKKRKLLQYAGLRNRAKPSVEPCQSLDELI